MEPALRTGETPSLDTARSTGNAARRPVPPAPSKGPLIASETVQVVIIVTLAIAAVGGMRALGVFDRRPLIDAPPREMGWGLGVIAIACGVFLLGGVAYGAIAGPWIASFAPSDALPGEAASPDAASIDAVPPADLMGLTLLSQALIQLPTAGVLIYAACRQRGGARRVGLIDGRGGWHVMVGGAGLALLLPVVFTASIVASTVAQWWGGSPPAIGHRLLGPMFEAAWPVRLGFFASAIVVAPVLEELIFRGLLQTSLLNLLRRGGVGQATTRWMAIVGTTGVFLALHLGDAAPHALPALAVLSIGLGYLYERTGSLVVPVVAHAGFNAVNVAMAAAMLAGPAAA
jgi:membrane protease YdiL (CAAX protease family)